MSQRRANIIQSQININGIGDPKQLINTNNDDLIAIEDKNVYKKDNSPIEANKSKIPLIKDNNLNNNVTQNQSLIMGNPYGGGTGLYGGSIGGYGGLYNGLGGYGNGYSGYGGYGMNIPGRTETFFDKIFMTVERANYQMFHLCEMIKMIQHQTPTIKYFYELLTRAYYYFFDKSKEVYEKAKILLLLLSKIMAFQSLSHQSQSQESLTKEIKVLDYLIKGILITCLSGILIKLYSK